MTMPADFMRTRRSPPPAIDRRRVLAGAATAVWLTAFAGRTSSAQAAPGLRAREGKNPITGAPVPLLEMNDGFGPLVLPAGGSGTIPLVNQLAMPLVASICGAEGADARPLPDTLAQGATGRLAFGAKRPGTYLLRLHPEHAAITAGLSLPLIVRTGAASTYAADETLMIEEWPSPDGGAAQLTANRAAAARFSGPAGGTLRLRIVNACAWRPLAFLLPDLPANVIAIDSAPAEAFAPRERQITLAPGGRIDILLDLTGAAGTPQPILLHDGKAVRRIAEIALEARSDAATSAQTRPDSGPDLAAGLVNPRLAGAVRTDLDVSDMPLGPWRSAGGPDEPAPAFSLRAGQTASLALSHRFPVSATFRIEGHHARLLDRLDDGWKPFWLDTILVPAGEHARIAFAAPTRGRWRIECIPADGRTQPRSCAFEVT